jgi:hypothetical protein
MVAAVKLLNEMSAGVAPLPAFLGVHVRRELVELPGVGALGRRVCLGFAHGARRRRAPGAVVRERCFARGGTQEGGAPRFVAIHPIARFVLSGLGEVGSRYGGLQVVQHFLYWDMLPTALWRIEAFVACGAPKHLFKARHIEVVFAGSGVKIFRFVTTYDAAGGVIFSCVRCCDDVTAYIEGGTHTGLSSK